MESVSIMGNRRCEPTEFHEGFSLTGSDTHADGIGADQRRIVYEIQEGGLQQLGNRQRSLDTQQRNAWKNHLKDRKRAWGQSGNGCADGPFTRSVKLDFGTVHLTQPLKEFRLGVGEFFAQIFDLGLGEVEVRNQPQHLAETLFSSLKRQTSSSPAKMVYSP